MWAGICVCEHVCARGRGEEGKGGGAEGASEGEKICVLKRNWVGS